MKQLIHLIADYGVGDPAFTEVMQKLYGLCPDCVVLPTSVPKFSTLATGFWTHQMALVNPVQDMVIFTNTAPRKDNKEVRIDNEGEGLVYAELKNGVRVIGVNSGYSFSFIKPYIVSYKTVRVANKGSQFRSRDFYPDAVSKIVQHDNTILGDSIDPQSITDVPDNRIVWIDGYGNMKTTTRASSVKFNAGQPLLVQIGQMKRTAFYTGGIFEVREGELAFAPGSSGGEDRNMEIFLRGLSAWKEFGKPKIEQEFTISLE